MEAKYTYGGQDSYKKEEEFVSVLVGKARLGVLDYVCGHDPKKGGELLATVTTTRYPKAHGGQVWTDA